MIIQIIFIFLLYQILQIILLPFLILFLIIRLIKNKPTIGNIKERIGFVPKIKKTYPLEQKKIIWIHAVSVGEILSIQNLINKIKENKNAVCYVTSGTISGKKIAEKNLNYDYISFLPYDFLFSMLIAFKRIKPTSILIIEAELWPNFLILAKLFKIPVYSLNARISKRSENHYKFFKTLLIPILNIFKKIFTQNKFECKNFEKLGILNNKLEILGNIKTSNVLEKKKTLQNNFSQLSYQTNYKILLVGSLHPGELKFYLDLFKKLKSNFTNLKLILAPRHLNWKKELINIIQNTKYKYYSWENEDFKLDEIFFKNNDILLVCKLGELFNLYNLATIFYLGGTFVPIGGHNLLEPAVWAKPTIIGPYHSNCKDISDKLEKKQALIKVKNSKDLLSMTYKLLTNNELTKSMGINSQQWLLKEAIFVEKNLKKLIKNL